MLCVSDYDAKAARKTALFITKEKEREREREGGRDPESNSTHRSKRQLTSHTVHRRTEKNVTLGSSHQV